MWIDREREEGSFGSVTGTVMSVCREHHPSVCLQSLALVSKIPARKCQPFTILLNNRAVSRHASAGQSGVT